MRHTYLLCLFTLHVFGSPHGGAARYRQYGGGRHQHGAALPPGRYHAGGQGLHGGGGQAGHVHHVQEEGQRGGGRARHGHQAENYRNPTGMSTLAISAISIW